LPRAFISGTGLIGTSIALGLAEAGWETLGWDPDPDRLDTAAGSVAVRPSDLSVVGSLTAEELVVLAGPPSTVIETLPALDTEALVLDVAAVKVPVLGVERSVRFVGTHPMAGREQSGPGAASAGLFRGTAWVLTTDGASDDDLERVAGIVTELGARPIRMTAAAHDTAVAKVSHLPQLLAATLLETVGADPDAMELAAGSFRDLTRVASSDPAMWVDIIELNRPAVAAAAEELKTALDAALTGDGLGATLDEARALRATLGPALTLVKVALLDQPGELAAVGEALAASGVDVRDLQLRHAPYGGGGVLTLSVRPGEAGALASALGDVGFELVD
jgi:prephenate dehydrogenase